jgi:hypothetical protein
MPTPAPTAAAPTPEPTTPAGNEATGGDAAGDGATGGGAESGGPAAGVTGAALRGRSDVNGGNGPAAAGAMTAPPTGPAVAGPGAETVVAVGSGPAAGVIGGGVEGAPAVEASCDGGGDDTGAGSSGAPPPLPPSPALKPREKSFGAAGGTAEVGGVGRPAAGLVNPELRDAADDGPDGSVDEDMLGGEKLRPLAVPGVEVSPVPLSRGAPVIRTIGEYSFGVGSLLPKSAAVEFARPLELWSCSVAVPSPVCVPWPGLRASSWSGSCPPKSLSAV